MTAPAEMTRTDGAVSRAGAFRRLTWSNMAAQAAEQIGLAAAPMVAVLALGAGAGETGLLSAAQTLPFLLLSLPLGVLADRVARRRLMTLAEASRAVALAALPLLSALGWLSVPALAVIGFAAATGTVAYSVAAPALVPTLVPRTGLAAANGRLELARSVAFAGGPGLAGALVSWAGGSVAFVVAAALSALAVALLAAVPEPPRLPQPERHPLRALQEGAAFAWTHRLLRPVLLTAVVWNCSWFVLQAAYVPYAVRRLGLEASGIGATLACYGGGMLVGAVLAPRLMRRMTFGAAISAGPLVSVAAAVCMAATIGLPWPALAGAGFFLFGAGPLLWTIAQITLRQTVTPEPMLGRVSALVMTGSTGARPIGAALGGVIGVACGLECAVIVSALGFLVQALLILGSPLPRLEVVPDEPARA
ncbi:MAG TPA: MFS transporter [Methylomirabilota bacterium]|nr:MFS transporter [Methylomirabilota bacterium]